VEALEAPDARAAADAFERAAKASPGFGAIYVAWAQRLSGAGDPHGARQVIAEAAANSSQIPQVERARLALLSATLEGNRAAQQGALKALAQAMPADGDVLIRLGDQAMTFRRHADAVEAYLKAADRDPGNALLLNQLGYAQGYARDLAGAVRSLERYRKLRPEDANPLDSLGDVHYYLGRFAEAEKCYLEAWRRDAGFLGGGEPYKAAWARLMQGNRAGADDLFGKYIQVRRAARDPLAELARAEWEYLTGRRSEAVGLLEQLGKELGSAAAWVQLSVWSLEAGDRQRAREYAARAAAAARDPGSALMARVGQFLAGTEASAADWTSAAQRTFPDAARGMLGRTALAYALLLGGHYPAALPLLQELHNETPAGSGEPLNVLVAWALIETGRVAEVGDLLDTYPVRRPGAEQPFSILSFPRLFRLRGIMLEKQGRKAEAQAAYRLYKALGGVTRS
jgi:tetratricopeptide (TPR) repeat protein